jgi:hypothetical protein
MDKEQELVSAHPEGEASIGGNLPAEAGTSLDTFAGKIHVKWSPEATVSSLGLMPFFIEYLKTSGRFDQWVEDCPLNYTSHNAPEKRDVLGTLVLSVLAGHWRYAHINAIRGDGINPELLGMSGVASEDSVRRGMKAMDEAASGEWMKKHLKASYEPLLQETWVLDVDTTVKPLYGHQQDAEVGYNPTKPGRPSHANHSYFYEKVVKVKADVAAILIFFPGAIALVGRHRLRLVGGWRKGGESPSCGGSRSMGRASVVGWRGTCRGQPFPAPACPLGETGKGDQIPRCRRQFDVAPTVCTPLLSYVAVLPIFSPDDGHKHICPLLSSRFCPLSIRFPDFPEVSPPHPLLPCFYPHSEWAAMGPVQVGVRFKAQVHHHVTDLGCWVLPSSWRSFERPSNNTQSPEQGGGCRACQNF